MDGLLRKAQLAIVACLVSCGPAATPHDSRPKRAATPEAWSPLTWEERHDVMTFVVLPNMGRLFQEFRGTEYPDLTCDSCHGKDAERIEYRMPNDLPAIDPTHPAEGDPRMVKFMTEEVTPEMSELIESPITCSSCHPRKGAK